MQTGVGTRSALGWQAQLLAHMRQLRRGTQVVVCLQAAWLRATVGSMLGLGFLGEFFPKNRFWYMVWEPPSLHRLVTAS